MTDFGIDWKKVLMFVVLFTFIAVSWFYLVSKVAGCFQSPSPEESQTLFVPDVKIKGRVITKTDTVIKWYEKIIYKQSQPEVVYYQKTDTVFINQAKKLDLVMKLEKKGSWVSAYTINFRDTLLKQSIYTGIGNNFTVTAQDGELFVKSQKIYFNPLLFKYEQSRSLSSLKSFRHNIQALTGFNYLDKTHFNVGLKYNLSEPEKSLLDNFELKAEIIYKPF